MASGNVELVRSLYVDWGRGDFSSTEWADPQIEFVIADGPSPRAWKGLAGLAEGFRDWLTGWEDFRVLADDYRELDQDRVLVLVHGSGHARTTGLEVGQVQTREGANLFHLRDGRVSRLVLYYDCERAFADVGLPSDAQPAGS